MFSQQPSNKNNATHHQWLLSSTLDEVLQRLYKIPSVEISSDPADKRTYNISDPNKGFIKVTLQDWNKIESLLTINLNLSQNYMLVSLYLLAIPLGFFMILISVQVAIVFMIIFAVIIVIWGRRRKQIELQGKLDIANIVLSNLTKDVEFEIIERK